MLNKTKADKALKLYQSEKNRLLEQRFAALFSENARVVLSFVNKEEAYTDGNTIVTDPATRNIYKDEDVLKRTASYLKWPEDLQEKLLTDPWLAIKFVARAQLIHECLHILYTDFPPRAGQDPACSTEKKKRVMGLIDNIIEDAYIENAGCSVYDNLEPFLSFGRVAEGFAAEKLEKNVFKDLAEQTAEKEDEDSLLSQYFTYMVGRILYSFMPTRPYSPKLQPYITATEALFIEGSKASTPAKRYEYCKQIFNKLLPLIKENGQALNTSCASIYLGDLQTHAVGQMASGKGGSAGQRKGEAAEVILREWGLSTDKEQQEQPTGKREPNATNKVAGNRPQQEDKAAEKQAKLEGLLKTIIVGAKGEQEQASVAAAADDDCEVLMGESVSGKVTHKGIKIYANRLGLNTGKRELYKKVYDSYKLPINKYVRHFTRLLRAYVPSREEKKLFGSNLEPRRFGDKKRRFWYRQMPDIDVPDIAVLLLIDGSGSMSGRRCRAARDSALIMHEVLQKHGVPHAVVEHRGSYSDYYGIDINILFPFGASDEAKYNIMKVSANSDNRDGLALYWVEQYIHNSVANENKIIIVLSDGLPAHTNYGGTEAVRDTAQAVAKLERRGADVIGIALDESTHSTTYDFLKMIYPNLILCKDLKKLPGQILKVISRLLEKH